MKNIILLFFVLTLSFLYGCNDTHTEKNISLNRDILENSKAVKLNPIALNSYNLSAPKHIFVYKDSILIVENYANDGNYLVEMYNMNTHKKLTQLFHIGHGHNEVVDGNVTISDNKMIVNDNISQKSCLIDIDALLKGECCSFNFVKTPNSGTSNVAYFHNSPIIENPYAFADNKLKIGQPGDRLLDCENYKKILRSKHKYNTINVSGNGLIIVKPNQSRIVYASGNQSILELYDGKKQLIKSVTGPRKLNIDYYIDNSDGNNEIIFKGSVPYAYLNYYSTEYEFGLIYYGALVDASHDIFEDLNSFLLIFNWDGKLIKCLNLKCHAVNVSKSTKSSNVYYVTIVGKDKDIHLYKAYE